MEYRRLGRTGLKVSALCLGAWKLGTKPAEAESLEIVGRALDAGINFVDTGKVRYLGCSNFAAWQLCKALWISDVRGFARFDTIQPYYNAVGRDVEKELRPLCESEGVGIIPYSPLAGGFLTGKYRQGVPAPE